MSLQVALVAETHLAEGLISKSWFTINLVSNYPSSKCTCTYWNVISDYIVGSLLKNTRWIYVTLLQLITPWINACRFTNHSPDYPNRTVSSMSYCSSGLLTSVGNAAAQSAHTCRAHHYQRLPLSFDSLHKTLPAPHSPAVYMRQRRCW
jgi:hypothetical protein